MQFLIVLVKTHSIQRTLVNNDQIKLYFVPNGVEKTWEPKGAKHV